MCADETGRGGGRGVKRGGGRARGTVGLGVRTCGVDEMGGCGPCGGHDDASVAKCGGEETGETDCVWRGRADWFYGRGGGEWGEVHRRGNTHRRYRDHRAWIPVGNLKTGPKFGSPGWSRERACVSERHTDVARRSCESGDPGDPRAGSSGETQDSSERRFLDLVDLGRNRNGFGRVLEGICDDATTTHAVARGKGKGDERDHDAGAGAKGLGSRGHRQGRVGMPGGGWMWAVLMRRAVNCCSRTMENPNW
jgi:hypothetical protein